LYQAALGSEHAIGDETSARKWLERELASMGDGPHEPLVDPISPDGIARIHLRPYLHSGANPDALFDAFIQTAARFVGRPGRLPAYGQLAISMVKSAQLPFIPAEIEHFWSEMAEQDFPTVHHSSEFVAAYRPAYRVVLWDLLRDKLPHE
jgi:hypothetical protein